MKKTIRLTESDLTRIVKRVIQENKDQTILQKILKKLKGVSDQQIEYNLKHDLPWDWKGTKEGFYQKMENKKDHSGSN
jgi:hypothetical protein|tara:strand:- start:3280 stop:3513 length:234 start_codon:yes stop_codon:yes gene_type:complete